VPSLAPRQGQGLLASGGLLRGGRWGVAGGRPFEAESAVSAVGDAAKRGARGGPESRGAELVSAMERHASGMPRAEGVRGGLRVLFKG